MQYVFDTLAERTNVLINKSACLLSPLLFIKEMTLLELMPTSFTSLLFLA